MNFLRLFIIIFFSIFSADRLYGCNHDEGKIEILLKNYLKLNLNNPDVEVDKTTRYSYSSFDCGKACREWVVYITGKNWCASGGCVFIVLEKDGCSFKEIGSSSIIKLPIRLLKSVTNGRPDLGVWVQGGGEVKGYEALLPFDGKKYANNPTVPPARLLGENVKGEILIQKDSLGDLLYDK